MKQEDFNKLSIDQLCVFLDNHPKVLRASLLSIDDEPSLIKDIFSSHDVDKYLESQDREGDDYDYSIN